MANEKNGFTLVEVLIALSIVGVMLLLIIPLNNGFLEREKEKQFINEFTSDMLFMQAHSRTILSAIKYQYYPDQRKYTIYKDGGKPLLEKTIPNGWEIDMRTINEIQYSHNGNISKPGTIALKTKRHTYKFIFSLGKGRFRIEKE